VVVVADGALQRVPFAALVRPGTGGWLGLELEVVESPSIAVLRALRGRARPAPQGAVVLADPVFSAQDPRLPPGTVAPTGERFLARLPFTRQEAEAIAARLPPGEAETRLDFAANRAAVLSGPLAGRRLIHFATHGILDPTRPELSALVLSRYDAAGHPQDGDLRLGDLKGISLSAELVVLSGCETAIGGSSGARGSSA
jgi:CHAT domain-containing protein